MPGLRAPWTGKGLFGLCFQVRAHNLEKSRQELKQEQRQEPLRNTAPWLLPRQLSWYNLRTTTQECSLPKCCPPWRRCSQANTMEGLYQLKLPYILLDCVKFMTED